MFVLRARVGVAVRDLLVDHGRDDQDGGAAVRLAVEDLLADRGQPALDDLRVGVGEGLLPVPAAADAVDDQAGLVAGREDLVAVELVRADQLDPLEARLLEQLEGRAGSGPWSCRRA